jgi:hypothetical protein
MKRVRKLKPRKETTDKMIQSFTLTDFDRMLDNAIKKPARKCAPKSH